MALQPARPEDFAEAQAALRSEFRAPKAEVRNVAIATEIDADSYFQFRRVTYKAPAMSYKVGAQLQEIHLEIERISIIEEDLKKDQQVLDEARQLEHMQKLMVCYERAIAFFHAACYPLSFWRRWTYRRKNPFQACTAKEIGELLAFFSTCRMKSRVSISGSLASRTSLSQLSTPPTS